MEGRCCRLNMVRLLPAEDRLLHVLEDEGFVAIFCKSALTEPTYGAEQPVACGPCPCRYSVQGHMPFWMQQKHGQL